MAAAADTPAIVPENGKRCIQGKGRKRGCAVPASA